MFNSKKVFCLILSQHSLFSFNYHLSWTEISEFYLLYSHLYTILIVNISFHLVVLEKFDLNIISFTYAHFFLFSFIAFFIFFLSSAYLHSVCFSLALYSRQKKISFEIFCFFVQVLPRNSFNLRLTSDKCESNRLAFLV